MPIKEATFWFGITVFGTGLYGWMEGGDRVPFAIALTIGGFIATVYSVIVEHKPDLPKIPVWIGLLLVTWAAIGYDYYDRRANGARGPSRYGPLLLLLAAGIVLMVGRLTGSKAKPFEHNKLTIPSAFYGTGPLDERDVTEKLSMAATNALVVPVDNNFLGCDPAPMKTKRLRVEYSYGNLSTLQATRWEGGRLVLPEDSEIQRLTGEIAQMKAAQAAQPKPSQYPIPHLRAKVLVLVSELQGFLGQHGQEPKPQRQSSESDADYLRRLMAASLPWRAKVVGAYRLTFDDSVRRLRDEIRARASIDDPDLNAAISKAENANDPNGNAKAIEEIIRRLWCLALGINA